VATREGECLVNQRRAGIAALSILAVVGLLGSGSASAQASRVDVGTSYATISGIGSTWSANAIQQWARNVLSNYQWKVNYSDAGSSAGRQAFALPNGGADFAVSEIPYALKNSDSVDPVPPRHFAYMPIVAGGTSFMYNLVIGGKRVTNLRLGGATVSKIFSGAITKWNDPAIAADNPELALPAITIVPVVRSDGSGTSAQLTAWMRSQFPDVYAGLCQRAGKPAIAGSTLCGITSNFPALPGFKAQSGSNGVAGYVAQPQYVGSITYVEYSYALNSHFPVAKILNAAGYYTEPTAGNVAVALLKAQINQDQSSTDYLTQILGAVYTNPDPRTYPLSSYSYMLVPTALEYGFTLNKGKTLAAFANYFLCQGQQDADVLGYSALPINLAQAGLDQVLKIPGGDPTTVNIAKCNNPTFSSDGSNKLATTAPQPQACDKQGKTQCATGTGGAANVPTAGSKGGSSGSSGSSGASGSGSPSDESTDSTSGGSTGSASDVSSDTRPLTVAGKPMTIPTSAVTATPGLIAAAVAVLLVLGAIFGPPIMSRLRPRDRPRDVSPKRPKRRTTGAAIPKIHLRSVRRERAPSTTSTEGS
jgi:phosphate ABC transporter phosphate-binding protein